MPLDTPAPLSEGDPVVESWTDAVADAVKAVLDGDAGETDQGVREGTIIVGTGNREIGHKQAPADDGRRYYLQLDFADNDPSILVKLKWTRTFSNITISATPPTDPEPGDLWVAL